MSDEFNDFEQSRIDSELRELMSRIERPALSAGFEPRLRREIARQSAPSRLTTPRKWAMRFYWLSACLASVYILLALGSPEQATTWTLVGTVIASPFLTAAPQLLFRRRHRVGLLDLIERSVS